MDKLLITYEHGAIFYNIMRVVATQSGGVYFLYGYGGTGKTFIWKTLSSAIRSNGGIVLTVASMVLHHHYSPEEEQHILRLP